MIHKRLSVVPLSFAIFSSLITIFQPFCLSHCFHSHHHRDSLFSLPASSNHPLSTYVSFILILFFFASKTLFAFSAFPIYISKHFLVTRKHNWNELFIHGSTLFIHGKQKYIMSREKKRKILNETKVLNQTQDEWHWNMEKNEKEFSLANSQINWKDNIDIESRWNLDLEWQWYLERLKVSSWRIKIFNSFPSFNFVFQLHCNHILMLF